MYNLRHFKVFGGRGETVFEGKRDNEILEEMNAYTISFPEAFISEKTDTL